jgi:hypothetical protein
MNRCAAAKTCHDCGQEFYGNTSQRRCHDCRYISETVRRRAIGAVGRAVRRGLLPDLRYTNVACVDCGARAEHYDHRDYGKPLAVDPVCRCCNYRRGPAAPPVREVA